MNDAITTASAPPGAAPAGPGALPGAPAGTDPAALTMTPQAAQAEIERLKGDGTFTAVLLGQKGIGPAYREATARWQALNKAAASKAPRVADSTAEAEATGLPSRGDADAGMAETMLDAMAPPASPEDYKVNRHAVPNWDQALETEARQLSHALGFSQGMFDGVVGEWNRAMANPSTTAQITEQGDATERTLVQRYGEAGAKAKLAAANSVIKALPPAQRARATELLAASGLGNSLFLIERLAMVAARKGSKP